MKLFCRLCVIVNKIKNMSESKLTSPSENSQCRYCEYHDMEYPDTCPAFFPDKIPQGILSGESTHEEPVKGQKIESVLFEPNNEHKFPSL